MRMRRKMRKMRKKEDHQSILSMPFYFFLSLAKQQPASALPGITDHPPLSLSPSPKADSILDIGAKRSFSRRCSASWRCVGRVGRVVLHLLEHQCVMTSAALEARMVGGGGLLVTAKHPSVQAVGFAESLLKREQIGQVVATQKGIGVRFTQCRLTQSK